MDTTAQIECVHGYPEGCPDCDVASYLPSVLDAGQIGHPFAQEVAGEQGQPTTRNAPNRRRTEIVDEDGWMAAPNLAPENFPGGG